MRLAIISDIHANLEALNAVLEDLETQKIDQTICLGDIIGYGPNPNECIELVRKQCPVILLGNHDAASLDSLSTQNFNINAKIAIEWTEEQLSNESKSFLHDLPMITMHEDNTFVHATPYEPKMWYYIQSVDEAAFNFEFFDTKYCFVGHTHIPFIFSMNTTKKIRVSQDTKFEFDMADDVRYLVNVGSVGQPRDRNPRACYAIIDTEVNNFLLRRINYDIKLCQEKMRKSKLPDFLITRLAEGK
ncbi:MAG: metallophosphoesterase family protein [Chitinivibrionales bacterium]|nr:metallophosphoesterase family protein [Chitinivibrionales bacterium]